MLQTLGDDNNARLQINT